MLWKWTTPWFTAVSFKKSLEYQPTFFSESQSNEWQTSDTMFLFSIKHMIPICWESCNMNTGTTSVSSCLLSKSMDRILTWISHYAQLKNKYM